MYELSWMKCHPDRWCSLRHVNLSRVTESGVWIVWHGGHPPRTVHIGQGPIATELEKLRADPTIMQYEQYGPLLVTWAAVGAGYVRDQIESYLAAQWKPLVHRQLPARVPAAVNSPFG